MSQFIHIRDSGFNQVIRKPNLLLQRHTSLPSARPGEQQQERRKRLKPPHTGCFATLDLHKLPSLRPGRSPVQAHCTLTAPSCQAVLGLKLHRCTSLPTTWASPWTPYSRLPSPSQPSVDGSSSPASPSQFNHGIASSGLESRLEPGSASAARGEPKEPRRFHPGTQKPIFIDLTLESDDDIPRRKRRKHRATNDESTPRERRRGWYTSVQAER